MIRRLLLILPLAALAACGSSPPPAAPPAPAIIEPTAVEDLNLSPVFSENIGRLPWPTAGVVTGFFGLRRDPETGTMTDAVGIDIATSPGASVHSAFGGTVERVGQMPTFGTFVMVSHEGWTTVYGNLSRVHVASGSVVETGSVLGASGTLAERRGASLFFAVFEGGTPANPMPWLRPRPLPDASSEDTTLSPQGR